MHDDNTKDISTLSVILYVIINFAQNFPLMVRLRQPWFTSYAIELIKWVDFEARPIKTLSAPVLSE